MAVQPTIPSTINIAKLSQTYAANDAAIQMITKGRVLDRELPLLIYITREVVDRINTYSPTDANLRNVSNYLFDLCGPYQIKAQNVINSLSGVKPVVTGPNNVSVTAGSSAVFSITVSSATSYTILWYRNGVLIAGANGLTYTLNNAQTTDSGAVFSAVVSNAAGSTNSAQATLTVTATITGYFAYQAIDPFPTLNAGTDNLIYQINFSITHNSPIAITMPGASSPNQYLVVKVPIGENTKTSWSNDAFNYGTLDPNGDFNWRPSIVIGSFRYYTSRQALSLNTTQPLTLS